MLTSDDMKVLCTAIEQSVRVYLKPINESATVHLEFHKQLALRLNEFDETLRKVEEKLLPKT